MMIIKIIYIFFFSANWIFLKQTKATKIFYLNQKLKKKNFNEIITFDFFLYFVFLIIFYCKYYLFSDLKKRTTEFIRKILSNN